MKKLKKDDGRPFTQRDIDQGRHLREALVAPWLLQRDGPWGKGMEDEQRDQLLSPLKPSSAHLLNAHNGYAHAQFFRRLAYQMGKHLGATSPHWVHEQPVYLLTIVDRSDLIRDHGDEFILTPEMLHQFCNKIGRLIGDHDYVAMIDVALYVSTKTVFGVTQALHPHAHILIWNLKKKDKKYILEDVRSTCEAILPYASAAKLDEVKEGDLRQVTWYVGKMPRKQYQLYRGTTSIKQFKRDISATNAIRLYECMRNITLPDLAFGWGEGQRMLDAIFDDIGPKASKKTGQ